MRKGSDEESKKSEEHQLEETTEALTKSGTWKLFLLTNSIQWSAGVFRMLGYEAGEFMLDFTSAVEVIHPEDRERAFDHMHAAINEGKEYNFQKRLINKDGYIVHVVSKAHVIRDDEGRAIRLIGIFQDITEFTEKKRELRTILNSSLDLICVLDTEGRFTQINKASKEILGYSPAELEGRHFSDFIHKDYLDPTLVIWRELFKVKKVKNFENAYLHRDGRCIQMVWTAHYDLEQQRIYCVGRDVTELKQAELQIKKNERRFRSMIQAGGDFVAILSPKGIFTYVSPTYRRNLDYADEDLLGNSAYAFIHPEDRDRVKMESAQIVDGKQSITSPYRFQTRQGSWRWIRTTLVNLSQDPDIQGFIANSNDITDIIHANQKLTESEARFRGLYESQTNYVIRTDLEGRYTYVNRKFQDEFGWIYKNGEILGNLSLESIRDYHWQKVRDTVAECIEHPESIIKIEIDKPTKDGGTMTTLWDFICVPDASGAPYELQCMGIDITQRVQAEQLLIESNERFELINKATNDAIYDWDIQQDTFHWGESYGRIFGYKPEEVPTSIRDWEVTQHPVDIEKNRAAWVSFMEDSSRLKWQEIFRWRKGDGNYAFVEEIGYLIRDSSGRPLRMVGVLRDISDTKKNDLAQLYRQKISSLFKTSHPLTYTLEETLQTLCDGMEFHSAEFWLKSEENDSLSLSAFYVENALQADEQTFNPPAKIRLGEHIPGLVWEAKQTKTWDHLSDQSGLYPVGLPNRTGLRSCMAFPITQNENFVGTLVLYSAEPLADVHYRLEIIEQLVDYLGGEIRHKQQEEQMRLLFEWSPDILAIASPKGYFTKVNPAFCKLLGYSEKEILYKPFSNFVHPDDLPGTSVEFLETSTGIRQADNFINRYRTRTGTYKYISWGSSTPFGDDGYLFSYGKDVTPIFELQRMLQDASEMAKVGAWEIDLENGTHKWSPITRDIFEVPANYEPELDSVIRFYPPELQPFVKEKVDRAIELAEPFEFESTITTALGNEKWVRIEGKVEVVETRVVRLFGSVQDIHQHKTDQRAIEQALNERNNILESIGESFFSVDKNWNTLYWNKSAENLLHVPRGRVVGKNIWDAVPELQKHGLRQKCQEALKTKTSLHLESHDTESGKWLEIGIYPTWDQLGVFLRDISNRKKSEQEIRLSNERFQKIAEATNDAIWDFDVPKNSLFWGKGFEHLFSYKVHQVNPSLEHLISLIHPDDKDRICEKIGEYMQPSYPNNHWIEEYRFLRADGTYAHVVDRAIFIRDSFGTVTRVLGAMTDISQQKEHENSLKALNAQLKAKVKELAISNQELEQFAYVASHDLQEPLRMITSFLGQIERKYSHILDDKGKQYIGFAVDGSRRMRQIILDLLEYSRVGREKDQLESVNLMEIVEETKLLFRKTIEESKAVITTENLPTIQGFQVPIRQVFQNLISNALKYRSAMRTPFIHIKAIDKDDAYEITVQDNGLGIEDEYFDRIFIIFQRLNREPSLPGTGMGLAITKKIIENYGGNIWVDSELDVGSTFHFTLKKDISSH
ncbi:MAG: PAS domain S-box protein [Lunatimonas sp.]|uniref:PAS domain S-box protein n=1 Tax=Lunatimonas sp. TaxID=2060141 RepID=UPI00263A6186|nr:PAS domain S-box protein [Lunatimonas sp.]MCC5938791.1 PAS domain S-box protein [Lunatimonas sp.]